MLKIHDIVDRSFQSANIFFVMTQFNFCLIIGYGFDQNFEIIQLNSEIWKTIKW